MAKRRVFIDPHPKAVIVYHPEAGVIDTHFATGESVGFWEHFDDVVREKIREIKKGRKSSDS